jgi:lipid-binding SYLF domain-containing protein
MTLKGIMTGILAGVSLAGAILATTGSAEARFFSRVATPQQAARSTFNCPRCSDGQQRPTTDPSNPHYGWGKAW